MANIESTVFLKIQFYLLSLAFDSTLECQCSSTHAYACFARLRTRGKNVHARVRVDAKISFSNFKNLHGSVGLSVGPPMLAYSRVRVLHAYVCASFQVFQFQILGLASRTLEAAFEAMLDLQRSVFDAYA